MSVPSHPPHVAVLTTAIWVDGQRHAADKPHISARDRGFTLADGVFETLLVRNGRVFRLEHHLSRLADAQARLSIPAVPDLKDWLIAAVRASALDDASVRLTVTRGVGPGGVAPPLEGRPSVVVAVTTPPSFPASIYTAGLSCHIASGRRNERAMTAGLKTLADTDAVAGLLEAQHAGVDEALFLDTEDHCSEATSSNVFIWTGSTLVTPPLSCAALPGITRAAVLELAGVLGIAATERSFVTDDLLAATESFLTSSLRGIAPLVRVGAHPVGVGAPGPVTRQLTDAYRALVERECSR